MTVLQAHMRALWPFFGTARRAGKAEDLRSNFVVAEIAFVRDADLAGFRVAADVAGGEPVDVVENARSGDGGCPRTPSSAGWKTSFTLPQRVSLLSASHCATPRPTAVWPSCPQAWERPGRVEAKPSRLGRWFSSFRFLDGEAVDVEAKRGDGTGTARVEHADAARVAAHALEEGFETPAARARSMAASTSSGLRPMTASGLIT